jgi:TolB-like protein
MALTAGTCLGPYEMIVALGAGGMGEVYRARDTRLNRDVAIKILPAQVAADRHLRERFDREAKAVAALSHPNIVGIYDVGTHDGIPYAAIELLEGATLGQRISGTPLPLRTVVDFAVQIGRGLAAAHERGIVHRDLKPENIFVTRDGHVKILDFGLATEPATPAPASMATRLPETERGMMLGTVGYMSPEQARGEPADTRSDIFAFGCVLYEMVSGRRAFKGETRIETLHAILKDNPADLIASGRDIPPALDRLIMRCVEKAPASRFQTARDLVFALENLLDASTPSGHPRATPPAPARGWLAGAAAVLIVVIGAGTWWAVTTRRSRVVAPVAATAKPVDQARRLLAVLPFENITRDGKPGYFGAGMTDEVASQLSKLSALRVVGRAAVAKFKDARTDLPAMVKELDIGSVVTGSVREDGSRVRVTVELMDARSGALIWSEQYDREAADVFAVQSDIALRVAEALNASVTLDEQARVGKRPTSSVAAYQLFVRARGLSAVTPDQLKHSIELLRQAVALDPQFALAYGLLANRYYFAGAYGDLSALPRGLDAGHKAIAIDPQLAAGHHGLGINLMQMGRLSEALVSFRKAVELDRTYTGALNDLEIAEISAGRYDQAFAHARDALALTPNLAYVYYHVGATLILLDDDARTERFLTAASARFPTNVRLAILLSYLDTRRGRGKEALQHIGGAVERAPANSEGLMTRAEIATAAGAPDAALLTEAVVGEYGDGLTQLLPYTIKMFHAYHLQMAGQKAEAAIIMDAIVAGNQKAITGGADSPVPLMQIAAIHALRGEASAALDGLDRAYAAGWRDGRTLAIDPMFTSIRNNPRFTQLLSRIRDDVAAMRARTDYSSLGL